MRAKINKTARHANIDVVVQVSMQISSTVDLIILETVVKDWAHRLAVGLREKNEQLILGTTKTFIAEDTLHLNTIGNELVACSKNKGEKDAPSKG